MTNTLTPLSKISYNSMFRITVATACCLLLQRVIGPLLHGHKTIAHSTSLSLFLLPFPAQYGSPHLPDHGPSQTRRYVLIYFCHKGHRSCPSRQTRRIAGPCLSSMGHILTNPGPHPSLRRYHRWPRSHPWALLSVLTD